MKYLIANSNPLIVSMLKSDLSDFDVIYIDNPKKLTIEFIQSVRPKYIFFPHWSYYIPSEIHTNFECILFHMTDLPFGKGGSPLQNLITRGIYHTKISALKVISEIDAGPIFLKKDLCLNGNAEEIFIRSSHIITEMIREIIIKNLSPNEQIGDSVYFKRRTPEMSTIDTIDNIDELFDHIRMLDAENYPNAFLENKSFIFHFSRAALKHDNTIICDVRISKK